MIERGRREGIRIGNLIIYHSIQVASPEKSCVQVKVRENAQKGFMARWVESLVTDCEIVLDIKRLRQDAVQHFQRRDLWVDAEFSPFRRKSRFAFLEDHDIGQWIWRRVLSGIKDPP